MPSTETASLAQQTLESLFSADDVHDIHTELALGRLPRYQRLAKKLRQAIIDGKLAAGECFPPERELAQVFNVSRDTVRRALEELTTLGLIEARKGSGTFVSQRLEQPLSVISSFSDDMKSRGFAPGSFWIKREIAVPTARELQALELAPGALVMRLDRVRTADDAPMAIERAVIDAALLRNDINFGNSLYLALQNNGHKPYRASQRLRAELATEADAALLRINAKDAVLNIERRSYAQDGRAIELTNSIYRGDRYDYVSSTNADFISMTY